MLWFMYLSLMHSFFFLSLPFFLSLFLSVPFFSLCLSLSITFLSFFFVPVSSLSLSFHFSFFKLPSISYAVIHAGFFFRSTSHFSPLFTAPSPPPLFLFSPAHGALVCWCTVCRCQVNPHVVPFLRSRMSSSRNSLLHRLAVGLWMEVIHRTRQLADAGFLPAMLGWVQDDLNSPIEGHITIVPALSWKALLRALQNPSAQALKWSISLAEHSTYPCLSTIQTRCCIEVALNEALYRTRTQSIARQHFSEADTSIVRQRSRSLAGAEPDEREAHIPPRRRDVPSSPDIFYSDQARRRPMCQVPQATTPDTPSPPRPLLSAEGTLMSSARSVSFHDSMPPSVASPGGTWFPSQPTIDIVDDPD